jgi:hypothetical protein
VHAQGGHRRSQEDSIARGAACVECPKDIGPLDRLAPGQLGKPLPLARDSKVSTHEIKDIVADRLTLFGGSSSNRVVKIWRDILYLQRAHGMIL